jgi:hypothetical protein
MREQEDNIHSDVLADALYCMMTGETSMYLDTEKIKTNKYMSENLVPEMAPTTNLPFEVAHRAAKDGRKIQRAGWNGANQFAVMMPPLYLPPYNTQGTERKVNDRTAKWIGEDEPLDCQPYYALYNAQKKWQPGWVPSQGDLFANDWQIID